MSSRPKERSFKTGYKLTDKYMYTCIYLYLCLKYVNVYMYIFSLFSQAMMICATNGSIYLSSWTASAERSREEEETAENMEASDGLLLQVNNGEQWCNRWKHPGEDLVSNWLLSPHRNLCCCCCFYPVSCRKGCIKCLCVPLNLAVVVVCRTAAPAPRSCAALPALGGKACWTERGPLWVAAVTPVHHRAG